MEKPKLGYATILSVADGTDGAFKPLAHIKEITEPFGLHNGTDEEVTLKWHSTCILCEKHGTAKDIAITVKDSDGVVFAQGFAHRECIERRTGQPVPEEFR